jgi:hypothetical protein
MESRPSGRTLRLAAPSGGLSVSQLDANPTLATQLEPEEAWALFRRLQFLASELLTAGTRAAPRVEPVDPLEDNISTATAAKLLGFSERSLRDRQHEPEIAALRIDNGTRRRVYSRERVLGYRARR